MYAPTPFPPFVRHSSQPQQHATAFPTTTPALVPSPTTQPLRTPQQLHYNQQQQYPYRAADGVQHLLQQQQGTHASCGVIYGANRTPPASVSTSPVPTHRNAVTISTTPQPKNTTTINNYPTFLYDHPSVVGAGNNNNNNNNSQQHQQYTNMVAGAVAESLLAGGNHHNGSNAAHNIDAATKSQFERLMNRAAVYNNNNNGNNGNTTSAAADRDAFTRTATLNVSLNHHNTPPPMVDSTALYHQQVPRSGGGVAAVSSPPPATNTHHPYKHATEPPTPVEQPIGINNSANMMMGTTNDGVTAKPTSSATQAGAALVPSTAAPFLTPSTATTAAAQPLPSSSASLVPTAAAPPAFTTLQSENDWLRQRLRTITDHYEGQLDLKEVALQKALAENKKLRKKLARDCPMLNGISMVQLKHTNERLSAQLARLEYNTTTATTEKKLKEAEEAQNKETLLIKLQAQCKVQQQQLTVYQTRESEAAVLATTDESALRVKECEAAITELMGQIEILDKRLREQISVGDDAKVTLHRQLEAQQAQFNVERLECDRVVHALSAKLEELARENGALRKHVGHLQQQQQHGGGGGNVIGDMDATNVYPNTNAYQRQQQQPQQFYNQQQQQGEQQSQQPYDPNSDFAPVETAAAQ